MSDVTRQGRPAARPRDEVIQILRDSGLVDEDWYRRIYRDVANRGGWIRSSTTSTTARQKAVTRVRISTRDDTWRPIPTCARRASIRSFITSSTAREGRRASRTFDTAHYLAENPDVADAGVNPFLHYLRIGLREERSGRRYPFGAGRRG